MKGNFRWGNFDLTVSSFHGIPDHADWVSWLLAIRNDWDKMRFECGGNRCSQKAIGIRMSDSMTQYQCKQFHFPFWSARPLPSRYTFFFFCLGYKFLALSFTYASSTIAKRCSFQFRKALPVHSQFHTSSHPLRSRIMITRARVLMTCHLSFLAR